MSADIMTWQERQAVYNGNGILCSAFQAALEEIADLRVRNAELEADKEQIQANSDDISAHLGAMTKTAIDLRAELATRPAAPAPEAPTAAPSARTLANEIAQLEPVAKPETFANWTRQEQDAYVDGYYSCRFAARALATSAPTAAQAPEVAADENLEPAPPNSLPDWRECSLRVGNSDFIAKRVAEGGYGPEGDSKLATELHRFIYEYDDADHYRSAWFLHRLELVIKEAQANALSTQPKAAPVAEAPTERDGIVTKWLIERKAARTKNAMWWKGGGSFADLYSDAGWTSNADEAIKFDDAPSATAGIIRQMVKDGIRAEAARDRFCEDVTITEHMWIGAAPATEQAKAEGECNG